MRAAGLACSASCSRFHHTPKPGHPTPSKLSTYLPCPTTPRPGANQRALPKRRFSSLGDRRCANSSRAPQGPAIGARPVTRGLLQLPSPSLPHYKA
jgi:hypothetical protein